MGAAAAALVSTDESVATQRLIAEVPDRTPLPREFSDFLIDLSVALHKFGMYPTGHPSLDPAAGSVATRAAQLLTERSQIALGVARRQLLIEGVATDAAQPVLRRLAEGLHRHHVGAISFLAGLTKVEVSEALKALAREPERHGAFGLAPADTRLAWPHLRVYPLSFEGLSIAGDDASAQGDTAGNGRAAELWAGLARAAMAGDIASPSTEADVIEPTALAKAIDEHPRAEADERVVIGYLLQIARELRTSAGADTSVLQRRTARLLAALSPDTLRRLVTMGGDAAHQRAFVRDAVHGMTVDAVLDIAKAAAESKGQTISHGLVRMLSKLAAHAEFGQVAARPAADAALREQVSRLLTDWQLVDPNPEAYGQVLQRLATTSVEAEATRVPLTAAEHPDPLRLVRMSLEVGVPGPMVARAIDQVVAQGRTSDLLQVLASLPEGSETVAAVLRARLGHPETVRAILSQPTADFENLDRLQAFMNAEGYEVLLDALATADNRTTRRRLLDRLFQAPLDLRPMIVARLHDARWFVQRNMLVLLDRIGGPPDGLSLTPWTTHADVRVRHEAIRLQLRVPAERHAAVRAALDDGHPRLVHSGLAAIQHECPGALAEAVGAIVADPHAAPELRGMAARALGRCRDRRALPLLLAQVDGGRTLLGRPRLAPRSPVMLAALRALADGWSADRRAGTFLELAAGASDPDIRRAVAAGGEHT